MGTITRAFANNILSSGKFDATQLTGTLPAANAASGNIIQVVQGTNTTRVTSNTTSYADVGLSVTITPSSSSNKIMIMGVMANCFKSNANSASSLHARLVRGATEILDICDRALLTASSGQEGMQNISFNYLDSPSTTAATTYKTQFHQHTAADFVAVNQQGGNSTSIIIAMEIVG